MKKFRLLLLDANVVIEIAKQGLWEQVVAKCDIHLARTVLDESQFYDDDEGNRHYIDLSPYVSANSISVFDLEVSQMRKFCEHFDSIFLEKLDPGEAESLAYLFTQTEECKICSADKIVFRVLGGLNRPDQGISLDEVLGQIGLGRRLGSEFTKAHREKWTQKGFQEGFTGIGIRRPER